MTGHGTVDKVEEAGATMRYEGGYRTFKLSAQARETIPQSKTAFQYSKVDGGYEILAWGDKPVRINQPDPEKGERAMSSDLATRNAEIRTLVESGKSFEEIGATLGLAKRTVRGIDRRMRKAAGTFTPRAERKAKEADANFTPSPKPSRKTKAAVLA